MAAQDKTSTKTLEERLAFALLKADAVAKYLLDEGLINETEFEQMQSEARAAHNVLRKKLR